MQTNQQERFLEYWKNNRDREKKLYRQLIFGLPLGLLISGGIIISVITDRWYERADMVANTELSPTVLIVAVIIIAVFTGFFYKKFRWDQNEQLYKELMAKKKKEDEKQDTENE